MTYCKDCEIDTVSHLCIKRDGSKLFRCDVCGAEKKH